LQGDLDGAFSAFDEGVSIGRGLVAEAPTNTLFQRQLATALGQLGGSLYVLNKPQPAHRAYYEAANILQKLLLADEALAIFEQLSHESPDAIDLQSNLNSARGDIASVLAAGGDVPRCAGQRSKAGRNSSGCPRVAALDRARSLDAGDDAEYRQQLA
jgi:hypothetical protein